MVNVMESGNSPSRGSGSESVPTAGTFADLGCLLASLPGQLELKPSFGSLGQSSAAIASAASVLGSKLGLTHFFSVSAKQPLPAAYRFGPFATKLSKKPGSNPLTSNWKVRQPLSIIFISVIVILHGPPEPLHCLFDTTPRIGNERLIQRRLH